MRVFTAQMGDDAASKLFRLTLNDFPLVSDAWRARRPRNLTAVSGNTLRHENIPTCCRADVSTLGRNSSICPFGEAADEPAAGGTRKCAR